MDQENRPRPGTLFAVPCDSSSSSKRENSVPTTMSFQWDNFGNTGQTVTSNKKVITELIVRDGPLSIEPKLSHIINPSTPKRPVTRKTTKKEKPSTSVASYLKNDQIEKQLEILEHLSPAATNKVVTSVMQCVNSRCGDYLESELRSLGLWKQAWQVFPNPGLKTPSALGEFLPQITKDVMRSLLRQKQERMRGFLRLEPGVAVGTSRVKAIKLVDKEVDLIAEADVCIARTIDSLKKKEIVPSSVAFQNPLPDDVVDFVLSMTLDRPTGESDQSDTDTADESTSQIHQPFQEEDYLETQVANTSSDLVKFLDKKAPGLLDTKTKTTISKRRSQTAKNNTPKKHKVVKKKPPNSKTNKAENKTFSEESVRVNQDHSYAVNKLGKSCTIISKLPCKNSTTTTTTTVDDATLKDYFKDLSARMYIQKDANVGEGSAAVQRYLLPKPPNEHLDPPPECARSFNMKLLRQARIEDIKRIAKEHQKKQEAKENKIGEPEKVVKICKNNQTEGSLTVPICRLESLEPRVPLQPILSPENKEEPKEQQYKVINPLHMRLIKQKPCKAVYVPQKASNSSPKVYKKKNPPRTDGTLVKTGVILHPGRIEMKKDKPTLQITRLSDEEVMKLDSSSCVNSCNEEDAKISGLKTDENSARTGEPVVISRKPGNRSFEIVYELDVPPELDQVQHFNLKTTQISEPSSEKRLKTNKRTWLDSTQVIQKSSKECFDLTQGPNSSSKKAIGEERPLFNMGINVSTPMPKPFANFNLGIKNIHSFIPNKSANKIPSSNLGTTPKSPLNLEIIVINELSANGPTEQKQINAPSVQEAGTSKNEENFILDAKETGTNPSIQKPITIEILKPLLEETTNSTKKLCNVHLEEPEMNGSNPRVKVESKKTDFLAFKNILRTWKFRPETSYRQPEPKKTMETLSKSHNNEEEPVIGQEVQTNQLDFEEKCEDVLETNKYKIETPLTDSLKPGNVENDTSVPVLAASSSQDKLIEVENKNDTDKNESIKEDASKNPNSTEKTSEIESTSNDLVASSTMDLKKDAKNVDSDLNESFNKESHLDLSSVEANINDCKKRSSRVKLKAYRRRLSMTNSSPRVLRSFKIKMANESASSMEQMDAIIDIKKDEIDEESKLLSNPMYEINPPKRCTSESFLSMNQTGDKSENSLKRGELLSEDKCFNLETVKKRTPESLSKKCRPHEVNSPILESLLSKDKLMEDKVENNDTVKNEFIRDDAFKTNNLTEKTVEIESASNYSVASSISKDQKKNPENVDSESKTSFNKEHHPDSSLIEAETIEWKKKSSRDKLKTYRRRLSMTNSSPKVLRSFKAKMANESASSMEQVNNKIDVKKDEIDEESKLLSNPMYKINSPKRSTSEFFLSMNQTSDKSQNQCFILETVKKRTPESLSSLSLNQSKDGPQSQSTPKRKRQKYRPPPDSSPRILRSSKQSDTSASESKPKRSNRKYLNDSSPRVLRSSTARALFDTTTESGNDSKLTLNKEISNECFEEFMEQHLVVSERSSKEAMDALLCEFRESPCTKPGQCCQVHTNRQLLDAQMLKWQNRLPSKKDLLGKLSSLSKMVRKKLRREQEALRTLRKAFTKINKVSASIVKRALQRKLDGLSEIADVLDRKSLICLNEFKKVDRERVKDELKVDDVKDKVQNESKVPDGVRKEFDLVADCKKGSTPTPNPKKSKLKRPAKTPSTSNTPEPGKRAPKTPGSKKGSSTGPEKRTYPLRGRVTE